MRPQVAPVVAAIALVPYAIPALTILILHRPENLSSTLTLVASVAGLCNLLLAGVTIVYWSTPMQNEDYGWPVTDIALLSVFLTQVLVPPCGGWFFARRIRR
jgi:hypothetical protein